ncbi:MAG: cytochrome c3 family protein [Acidobacteriota bacterium]
MIFDDKLSPAERLTLGLVTLMIVASGLAVGRAAFRPSEAVQQPIQFNHQKHVQTVGLDCSTCHQYYTERQHSGLPALALCQTCHGEPVTDSPEERKLIELAASSSPPEFKKLFRLPDHTFYSHRRHVSVAKLPCETCHGDIAATTEPPARPLLRVTMETCTDCHAQQTVQTDCTPCHR